MVIRFLRRSDVYFTGLFVEAMSLVFHAVQNHRHSFPGKRRIQKFRLQSFLIGAFEMARKPESVFCNEEGRGGEQTVV